MVGDTEYFAVISWGESEVVLGVLGCYIGCCMVFAVVCLVAAWFLLWCAKWVLGCSCGIPGGCWAFDVVSQVVSWVLLGVCYDMPGGC